MSRYLNNSAFRGRKFRILIVEIMELEWAQDPAADPILMGTPDEIVVRGPGMGVHPAEEHREDGWSTREFLVAGLDDWTIPAPHHPDFVSIRVPQLGEVFESRDRLFWLANDQVIEIGPETYAYTRLNGRHGDALSSLQPYFNDCVFDDTLAVLCEEYGYEIEGPIGRAIIDRVSAETEPLDMIHAPADIADEIAARVHHALMDYPI